MLPAETQHRIYDQIPREITIDWREPRHGESNPTHSVTIDVTVREQRTDDPPMDDYPLVAVAFDPNTVAWGPGQRLPDTHHRIAHSDPEIAYTELVGEDVYDQLNIIVAVADDHGPIPRQVVAKKLAQEVYATFLLGVEHLNDPATIRDEEEYIWPVKIEETTGEGMTRLPTMQNGHPVTRYSMQFNARYTMREAREVPAVDSIEYEARVRHADGSETDGDTGSVDLPDS